jgi:hypothetical protein
MSTPNYRAMQVASAAKKGVVQALSKPGDVKPRYMAMGSWRASLSKGGAYSGK